SLRRWSGSVMRRIDEGCTMAITSHPPGPGWTADHGQCGSCLASGDDEILAEIGSDGFAWAISGFSRSTWIAKPLPRLSNIEGHIRRGTSELIREVVVRARVPPDLRDLDLVEFVVIAPVGVLGDVDGALVLGYQMTDTSQRETRHHLFHVHNLEPSVRIGVGPVNHEEIREAREQGAEIRTGAILTPEFRDSLPATTTYFHREEKIVGFEAGGEDNDVNVVGGAIGRLYPVRGYPENAVRDKRNIFFQQCVIHAPVRIHQDGTCRHRRRIGKHPFQQVGTGGEFPHR